MSLKGIAWSMTGHGDGDETILYAVTGRRVYTRASYGGEWSRTVYVDKATADRAVLHEIQIMEQDGAAIVAGPVGFELVGRDAEVAVPQMVGLAAERALGPVSETRTFTMLASVAPIRGATGRWVRPPQATL